MGLLGFGKKKHVHDGPVRVRPARLGGPVAVEYPGSRNHVVPDPNRVYPPDHVLVVTYPWLFVSDADLLAIEKAGFPTSVSLAELDLDADPAAVMRESIENSLAAGRALTPEEHATAELDAKLATFGMEFREDENGGSVVFAAASDPYQDEKLYTRTDMEMIAAVGIGEAVRLSTCDRAERALALATAGKLTPGEREHLAYIAAATNPVDAVRPGTPKLTSQQARTILDAAEHRARPRQAEPFVPSDQMERIYKPWA